MLKLQKTIKPIEESMQRSLAVKKFTFASQNLKEHPDIDIATNSEPFKFAYPIERFPSYFIADCRMILTLLTNILLISLKVPDCNKMELKLGHCNQRKTAVVELSLLQPPRIIEEISNHSEN